MARYPDFIAAKREEVPDYVRAAALQNHGDRQADAQNQANRERWMSAPVDAYESYSNITETNPLADAVRGWGKPKTAPAAETGAPIGMETSNQVASLSGGGMNAGSNAGVSSLEGMAAAEAGEQMSTMLPASNVVSEGASKGLQGSSMAAGAAVPVVGGLVGAGIKATDPNASGGDIALAGASGASSGALMTAAPALAAAGPVGWAGIAGLAALSLYGMLA
jgi:hypothetical protein